ncbi:MAG: hypothetical protein IIC52_05015 [Proteobacteria bacterium]|nr:hypothetical protein [Pseudomonadota bacterium]
MAFVRQRKTKAGFISTALIESYRDGLGRPRQRILANLYGAPDTTVALAKLAAQRRLLRKENRTLTSDLEKAEEFYAAITRKTIAGQAIDHNFRVRARLLKRAAKIKADLGRIQKDGAIIKKHCTATDGEIQKAIRDYKKELEDAEMVVLGSEWGFERAKNDLRQLTL